MDYSELFLLLKTRIDVDDLVSALDIVRDGLFKKSEGDVRADLGHLFTQNPQLIAKDNLASLRKQVLELRVVKLTVAVMPTMDLVETTSAYVKQTVGPDAIIEFTVDPTLVGGATIEFAGRFGDYSLKSSLEEHLHGL